MLDTPLIPDTNQKAKLDMGHTSFIKMVSPLQTSMIETLFSYTDGITVYNMQIM